MCDVVMEQEHEAETKATEGEEVSEGVGQRQEELAPEKWLVFGGQREVIH